MIYLNIDGKTTIDALRSRKYKPFIGEILKVIDGYASPSLTLQCLIFEKGQISTRAAGSVGYGDMNGYRPVNVNEFVAEVFLFYAREDAYTHVNEYNKFCVIADYTYVWDCGDCKWSINRKFSTQGLTPRIVHEESEDVFGIEKAVNHMLNGHDVQVYLDDHGIWTAANKGYDIEELKTFEYFRLTVNTIMVNGIEINEPLKEVPDKNSIYFPCLHDERLYREQPIQDADQMLMDRLIQLKIMHRTSEDAIKHAKALLGWSK